MTPEPSLPPASPPRLRTAHWFLLSALCGLVAAVRVGWTRGLDIPQEYLAYVAVSNFAVALILGGAATGLVIVMARRWRGLHHERPAPGYFLLLYVVVGYLLVGVIEVVIAGLERVPPLAGRWTEYDFYNAGMLAKTVAGVLVSFVFAWRIEGSWWWKGVPLVLGLALLWHVPLYYSELRGNWVAWLIQSRSLAQIALGIAIPLLALVASRRDRRQQLSRDWLHWLGVGLMVVAAVGGAMEGAYFWRG